ncbi:MAG TPA: hypothetical protein VLG71_01980 [Candidatus Limnocylindria bacterium]|nr:hypothetical protein [Candidatus Limnocylindria bacterium]
MNSKKLVLALLVALSLPFTQIYSCGDCPGGSSGHENHDSLLHTWLNQTTLGTVTLLVAVSPFLHWWNDKGSECIENAYQKYWKKNPKKAAHPRPCHSHACQDDDDCDGDCV